ncbi:hypothetical protein [Deinococcus multiflagellatus]|uniref:Uncharacterized protein n=1 Tax=Deinococcus multiflagellatus TaxID=1656887 RepID=A0ABW1ZRW8_9DEIO|nr:hypothetical protein [Deinococcus multiflagellatus]MBZ9715586.1 hypothetical protein [Deinococcus multiflagellatus]
MLALTAAGLAHVAHAAGPWHDPLLKDEWTVQPVAAAAARAFITTHHYALGAGRMTSAFGAFHRDCGSLLAVVAFNPPALGWAKHAATGTACPHQSVLALTRLTIRPDAPANISSFLISRAVRQLPERWQIISTYADEARQVVGVAYQAANFEYQGRSKPRELWTREGQAVSRKRGARTLNHAQMIDDGCIYQGKAAMHRYRQLRRTAERETRRNPATYPKPSLFLVVPDHS